MNFGIPKIAMGGPRWFKASGEGTEDDPHILPISLSDSDGNDIPLYYNENTGTYEIPVSLSGHICTENTTSTPLNASDTFTGEWQSTINYGVIIVAVFSDQASATDGLKLQFSRNGSDYLTGSGDVYTIPAGTEKTFSVQPSWEYFRVQYVNGGQDQTTFELSTTLKRTYVKPSSHRIQDNISSEDDAELMKSILTGEDPDGIFRNVQTSRDGNLTISDNSSGLAIAEGNVTDKDFIHKFGFAPDFDTTDGEVTVWDGAEDGVAWEQMVYQYSTTADIDYLSSNGSDYQPIQVDGLASDYSYTTQTITLQGTTPVSLTTNLIRVFRLINMGNVDLAGHVFCWVSGGGDTGGVPDVTTDIRAMIQPGNNQTEMAIFTVPVGEQGFMRDWFASAAGASRNSNYIIKLYARPFGQVFQLKHRSAISDTGSSYIQHKYEEPEVFEAKTDIEMTVEMTAAGATQAAISGGFDIVRKEL
jgi:hypothetical protein